MIPKVDPQVKYVGTTYLRSLNSDRLREFTGAAVVQAEDSEPLVVILPYATYLVIQQQAARWAGPILSPEDQVSLREQDPELMKWATEKAERTHLDATGPELSSGRGKASVETRAPRQKGDKTR